MEARKITIVETRNQKKSTIMSNATTLAELKSDLRRAGIDYTDMAFYEGLTKTELKSDSSPLPTDVNYRGTVTNNLVFMLTNTNKKIRSGAVGLDRKELYNKVIALNLQDEIKKLFGRNYTMVKTQDLANVVAKHADSMVKGRNNEEKTVNIDPECLEQLDNMVKNAVEALHALIEECYEEDLITDEAFNRLMNLLRGVEYPNDQCPYSDSEIQNMFKDM